MFYVVRDVNKFDFRRFTNETPNKPVEIKSFNDTESCFWPDLYVFHQLPLRVRRDPNRAAQIKSIILSKGQ